jgi:hypothetical protein
MAGKLMTLLRAPALLFYILARDVLYRSGTGAAINVAALAAGIVIVATHALSKNGPYNRPIIALGIAAITAPALWAAFKWRGIVCRCGRAYQR